MVLNNKKVFISYRRDNGIDIAARVRDYFSSKGFDVFLDITSMQLGKFDKQLIQHINTSDYFILILTEHALDRCADNDDWLRKEIECALSNERTTIIPFLLPQFKFPQELPKSIEKIKYYQGIEYNAMLFDLVMDKLFQSINKYNTIGDYDIVSQQAQTASKAYFKVILSERDGSLRIYSPECHSIDDKYTIIITKEIWNSFVEKCKCLIAAAFTGVNMNEIDIRLTSKLGEYRCFPNDGHYYGMQNTIHFNISFIRRNMPENYDGFVFKIGDIDGIFQIGLFKKGNFVFKSTPNNTSLAYFGIDENALLKAAKQMLQFTTGNKEVIVSNSFRRDVYSDGSGGYILDYISH